MHSFEPCYVCVTRLYFYAKIYSDAQSKVRRRDKAMALTRSFLRGMNLTDEQVSAIIEAHTETTDALKEQRDNYKADAEALKEAQKELSDLKAKADAGDDDEWQEKYEREHAAFEKYKTDQAVAKEKADKENAYRKLLKEVGISENRIDSIIKITDLKDVKIKDGALEDTDEIKKSVKEEWKDFIITEKKEGAGTDNPPGTDGSSIFSSMSLADKMTYANEHPDAAEVQEWLHN